MDETKRGTQDSPHVTGLASGAEGGITSTKTMKTYSEEEKQGILQKLQSDVKAADGRWRQTSLEKDTLQKSYDSALSRLEAIEERARMTELEGIRDNPDLLKLYQEKETLAKQVRDYQKREREIALREAKLADIEKETAEAKKVSLLSSVAGKVTPDKLEKLKALSMEALEVMADIIGKEQPTQDSTFVPDSGIGHGAGVDLNKLSPHEKIVWGLAHQKSK